MDEVTNKADGIPVEVENRNIADWVDGRLLHIELKIKTDFHHWLKSRCRSFGFVEGVDYWTTCKQQQINGKGRPIKKYFFSLNMAEKLTAFDQGIKRYDQVELKTFYFGNFKLRATLLDGKPWFFVTDICNIFAIDHRNRAFRYLEREVNATTIITNIGNTSHPILYQLVDILGLHFMFFRSQKLEITEACKWLVNELMPQVQKAFPTEKTSVFDKVFHFFKSFTGGAK